MPFFQRKVTTRAVIKCPECEREFYSDLYNRENVADSCHCGNLHIGIIETLSDSAYEHLMGTWYERTPPEIYDEPLPPEPEVVEMPRRMGFYPESEKSTKLSGSG